MWAIFRLRSNFSGAVIQDVWGDFFGYWGLGGGGEGARSRLYHGYWGYYTWIIISFLCTRVKVGFFSYAKDMLNSVAFSPRANHTDRAAAAGRRS